MNDILNAIIVQTKKKRNNIVEEHRKKQVMKYDNKIDSIRKQRGTNWKDDGYNFNIKDSSST